MTNWTKRTLWMAPIELTAIAAAGLFIHWTAMPALAAYGALQWWDGWSRRGWPEYE